MILRGTVALLTETDKKKDCLEAYNPLTVSNLSQIQSWLYVSVFGPYILIAILLSFYFLFSFFFNCLYFFP